MTANRCGSAVIVDNQQHLLGIFTDGDFRRHAEENISILAGFEGYEGYDQNPYAGYGVPLQQPFNEQGGMGPRWGSLPNLYDQDPGYGFVHLARNPRGRPLLQKLFGPNSVAQRRNILKRLDHQQMDPFEKTAQWLMQSDQRRMR